MADRNAGHNERDIALIVRIMQSDTQALEALMRLYSESLVSFTCHTVHSHDIAEEIVQDVFLSLWERRGFLDIHGSVAGYLFRAVRNLALNAVRHEFAQKRLVTDIVAIRGDDFLEIPNLGDVAVDAADLKLLVARILRPIPPRAREVFALSWEHGFSYQEIADLLGIGVPSVRNQMYRAIKRLTEYFKEHRRTPPSQEP